MTHQTDTTMSEKTSPPKSPPPYDGVSPDDLMTDFRGRSLGKVILVTLIVHAVFIGVFSIGYIREMIAGPGAQLTDEQRMSQALDDSTAELRKIADRYEVNVTDLKTKLDAGRAKPAAPAAAQPPTDKPAETPSTDKPEAPKSDIEKKLETKEPGPAVPDLSKEPKDDLFAPEKP